MLSQIAEWVVKLMSVKARILMAAFVGAAALTMTSVTLAQETIDPEAPVSSVIQFDSPFFDGYPKVACLQPDFPSDNLTRESLLRLELDVRSYRNCIAEYITTARTDIQRLTDQTNETITNYNDYIISLTQTLESKKSKN